MEIQYSMAAGAAHVQGLCTLAAHMAMGEGGGGGLPQPEVLQWKLLLIPWATLRQACRPVVGVAGEESRGWGREGEEGGGEWLT